MTSKIIHLSYKINVVQAEDPWLKLNLIVRPDEDLKITLDYLSAEYTELTLIKDPDVYDQRIMSASMSKTLESLNSMRQDDNLYVKGYKYNNAFWDKLPEKFNAYRFTEYFCVNPIVTAAIGMLKDLRVEPKEPKDPILWNQELLNVTYSLEHHWH